MTKYGDKILTKYEVRNELASIYFNTYEEALDRMEFLTESGIGVEIYKVELEFAVDGTKITQNHNKDILFFRDAMPSNPMPQKPGVKKRTFLPRKGNERNRVYNKPNNRPEGK